MLPLKNLTLVGYGFGVPTWYNNFHLGVDVANFGDEIRAPFDGKVVKTWGPMGGNTIWFYPSSRKEMIRFLHCDRILKTGMVKEGEVIAIVGYTGDIHPPGIAGSHTHIDISKNGILDLNNINNFLNPSTYDWVGKESMILVNDNGTYYVEGELGYFGINQVDYLNLLLKLTKKIENRKPVGVMMGVIEPLPQTPNAFAVKDK